MIPTLARSLRNRTEPPRLGRSRRPPRIARRLGPSRSGISPTTVGHPDGLDDGNYVKPTLLTATNDDTIAREEIFGPVLALITYRDEEDAIAIANDSPYGLHAYIAVMVR
jgi:acyl-CoA reductase-like NAD-dependent aldehyde dehydrogenase